MIIFKSAGVNEFTGLCIYVSKFITCFVPYSHAVLTYLSRLRNQQKMCIRWIMRKEEMH